METSKGEGLHSTITLSLVALTAVLTYMESQPPLISQRPKRNNADIPAVIGGQTVTARLWEDPLGVISNTNAVPTDVDTLRLQTHLHATNAARSNKENHFEILAVLTEGHDYSEDTEVRLRQRYAVQMALLDRGYTPEDRSHLGLLKVPWPKGQVIESNRHQLQPLETYEIKPGDKVRLKGSVQWTNSRSELTLISPAPAENGKEAPETGKLAVPFEWFGATSGKTNHHVLVLWLREEEFGDFPLKRLFLLADHLFPPTSRDNAFVANRPAAIRVIGPRSSNTLRAMTDDLQPYKDPDKCPQHLIIEDRKEANYLADLARKFHIYSPSATAPDWTVFGPRTEANRHRQLVKRLLVDEEPGAPIKLGGFESLITTDDVLAEAIVKEMGNRGLNILPGVRNQIVLISEADTLYGRSLPQCIAAAYHAKTNPCEMNQALAKMAVGSNLPPEMVRFSYLRGLDGTTAAEAKNAAESKDSKPKESDGGTTGTGRSGDGNRAEGDAQFDYMQRVADGIQRELRRAGDEKHGHVKAICVLGSDVYDKLIALQALRARFPDAICFTTDMDARLTDLAVNRFTRNLVVASGYSLSATNEQGAALAPFRDAYQTAIYYACQQAVGRPFKLNPHEVGLFEIGRTEAVRLGEVAPQPWHRILLYIAICGLVLCYLLLIPTVSRVLNLAREGPNGKDSARDRAACCDDPEKAIAVSGAAIQDAGKHLERAVARILESIRPIQDRDYRRSAYLAFGSFLVLGVVAVWQGNHPDGEPLRLAEGVSVWPTEFIRWGAVVLAWAFLVNMWNQHRSRRWNLWLKYFGDDEQDLEKFVGETEKNRWKPSCSGWISKWQNARLSAWRNLHANPTPQEVNARELFKEFVDFGKFWPRTYRIVPLMLLHGGISLALIKLNGMPNCPVRGPWLPALDFWILLLAIFSYMAISYYVIDAIRRAETFISLMNRDKTVWSPRVISCLAHERGMDPAHLNGYLDCQFISELTKDISSYVFHPFYVLMLMMLARAKLFDNWEWSRSLIFVIALCPIITLVAMVSLRQAARKARDKAMDQLQEAESAYAGAEASWEVASKDPKGNLVIKPVVSDDYSAKVRLTLEEIKGLKEGAYVNWLQDPSVIGILIPSCGAALFVLVQKLFSN